MRKKTQMLFSGEGEAVCSLAFIGGADIRFGGGEQILDFGEPSSMIEGDHSMLFVIHAENNNF